MSIDLLKLPLRPRLWLFLIVLLPLVALAQSSETVAIPPAILPDGIRVLNSATGCAIPVEGLALSTESGQVTIRSPNYRPAGVAFATPASSALRINVILDPVNPPSELSREYIDGLRSRDRMVLVGFVTDEAFGQALQGVKVTADSLGISATTDSRGFFELLVPVPEEGDTCTILFQKPGFRTQRRDDVEIWPSGDWTYQIALKSGDGLDDVDERLNRRISSVESAGSQTIENIPVQDMERQRGDLAVSGDKHIDAMKGGELVSASGSGDFAVRVPRTIRVLRQDGATVDYVSLETYTKRVLPSEWVASWGSFNGGINSLKAGAVAIRTFAAGYVSNPLASGYDICGSTSCQVYNPSANNSLANAAVDQTSGYVMVPPGSGRITYKLTEYSAENNSLGFSCGDGYTQPVGGCIHDAVCAGETRFGHGRGMCQWGTAKWATGLKFPGDDFPLDGSTTNGFPKRDWVWISQHYYPHLELTSGSPLIVGDFVKVMGSSSLTVRECAGGSISSGMGCLEISAKPSDATGTIIAGPVQVVGDGFGYTWWRVRWFDGSSTEGWSPENWLERTTAPPDTAPVLAEVPPQFVNEGVTLTITNTASAPESIVRLITDFEEFGSGTASGTILFRQPTFSGSTSAQLDSSPNLSSVTDSFPAGNASTRALHVNWSWLSSADTWMRLTTFNAANIPNPVIELDQVLSFDIYSSRDLKVAVGVRETGNAVGTPIGSDGGSSGGIEIVGATNGASIPAPVRTVGGDAWTTLSFDLATEPVRNLAGGNGVLSTLTGLGTLEDLALVPAAGSSTYDMYLDNFALSSPNMLTFALSNAPPGAVINPTNGVVTWTPTEAQGPDEYEFAVVVTDSHVPPGEDATSVSVTVNEVNEAPVLIAVSNVTVHAGSIVTFNNEATDPDRPENTLSFSLDPGAPAWAAIGETNGVFVWSTGITDAGITNAITVRVTDNGAPPLSDAKTFNVLVTPVPLFQPFAQEGENAELTWTAIPGVTYRIQYKTNLNQAVWVDLFPDITAAGTNANVSDPIGTGQRYYRVLVPN